MLPVRLVIDTNVLVSAALKPEGLQRTVFLLAITKPARLNVSHPLILLWRNISMFCPGRSLKDSEGPPQAAAAVG